MLQIHFTALDIEYHPSCDFDRLAVWEGEQETKQLIGTYCGTTLPPDITSEKTIQLVLQSDRIGRKSGFQAQYKIVSSISQRPGKLVIATHELHQFFI